MVLQSREKEKVIRNKETREMLLLLLFFLVLLGSGEI